MSAIAPTVAVAADVDQTNFGDQGIEVSVVMPCLNEHETVGVCVQKAVWALSNAGIQGEVIVADNGSTDGSIELAQTQGARVVSVPAKGYGNALMGGIREARGGYVIMGDADDSYDFLDVPKFVAQLRHAMTWFRAAACRPAEGPSNPARCLSRIAGWATRFSH
jgi:glycosyltransferase involved in cell wall biosynthesis